MGTADDIGHACALLRKIGDSGEPRLTLLTGGTNNRVYRVDTDRGVYCCKAYFRTSDEGRDRLGSEIGFLNFARSRGVRHLPGVLAVDSDRGMALFDFLDGRKPDLQDIDAEMVGQAIAFHTDLNRHRWDPQAATLLPASDACFSLADHINGVERRLNRLLAIVPESPVHVQAQAFVCDAVVPVFQQLRERVLAYAVRTGTDLEASLDQEDRCLSASDFGFHNAIILLDGAVRFIDFEYAGWDDPAKLIADVFGQADRPIPRQFLELFLEAVAQDYAHPDAVTARARLLLPVHRLKWGMIVLNDFLPQQAQRRRHSGEAPNAVRLIRQLEKSRRIIFEVSSG